MRAGLTIGLLAGALLTASVAQAAEEESELFIVAPDELALTAKSGGETKETSVFVKNVGPKAKRLVLTAVLEDGEGKTAEGAAVKVVDGASSLPANSVGRVRLKVTGIDDSEDLTGQLVVSAADAAPAAVDVEVEPKPDLTKGSNLFLFLPLVAALAIVGLRALKFGEINLDDRLGSLDLDFSKSFASTLTVLGAILGTILSGEVLPEEPEVLSKEALTALNVLFGALIVVAGVIYAAFQKAADVTKDGKTVRQYQGYVWAFLIACAVTIWAVLGELSVLFMIIVVELDTATGFTTVAQVLMGAGLVVGAVAMVIYAYRSMYWIAEPTKPPTRERVVAEPDFHPPARLL